MKLWKKILISLIIGLALMVAANYIPRKQTSSSNWIGGGITNQYGIPLISRVSYNNPTLAPSLAHNNTLKTVPLIINFLVFFTLGFGTVLVFTKFNNKY